MLARWREFLLAVGAALMCGLAGLALRQGQTPSGATLDALTARAGASRPGRRRPPCRGHRRAVAYPARRSSTSSPATSRCSPAPAALVANGEVYNYRELREANQLALRRPASDCEPPLHLCRRDGIGFAETLRGMYAIALHDRAAAAGWCWRATRSASSRSYLAEVPGGLAFASEPQALIAAGLVQPRVRAAARAELLQMQFTTGAETIFEGITRVLPGETVVIADGAVTERRRRAALPEGGPEAHRPRKRRWPGWMPRWRRACCCTSAATCPTACSCRAASTAPPCWR